MSFSIAVLTEASPREKRVAMVPAVAAQLEKLGAVFNAPLGEADLVLGVQAPSRAVVESMKPGAILVSFIHAQEQPELVEILRLRRITAFAMERVPRISRAQSLDALSSQAALGGYYAALLGATHLPRVVPRMTTAAGVLRPATALVMGLGVAGLQAIATLRRLGAMIEAYDVRPETKEEAESLGAKFVATGVDARGEGGYARELTAEEREKVTAALTSHIQNADLIITAAAVPGRRAPRLISLAQVAGMKPGAVIVDLGAEGGGNCEATRPGETITVEGRNAGEVTIVAPLNITSRLAENASELYAKNVFNLLKLMIADGQLRLDWTDEIVAQTALTHEGELKTAGH
ncbi:MAG TPA: NAD(P) transhydrogenase subunit alpha [Terriglobales bacterium]|nr:NAD(P) transhydrogenase subunit alpha [Terriglobales bacterium]